MVSDKFIYREASLVSLPVQLSYVIDNVISEFKHNHQDEGIKVIQRWRDADLWMVSKETWDEEHKSNVSKRVTIGAYSDSRYNLAFIPDIVSTDSKGIRYILPPERGRSLVLRDFNIAEYLASSEALDHGIVKEYLYRAWKKATELSPEQATTPVS